MVIGARPMFAVNCSQRRACSCPATKGNLSQMITVMTGKRRPARFQIRQYVHADFGHAAPVLARMYRSHAARSQPHSISGYQPVRVGVL